MNTYRVHYDMPASSNPRSRKVRARDEAEAEAKFRHSRRGAQPLYVVVIKECSSCEGTGSVEILQTLVPCHDC